MTRRLLILVAVALAALLLPACGGGGEDADEEPQKVEESGDLTRYEVSSAGFSIAVPKDWRTVSAEEAFTEDKLREMKADNPELAPFLDALEGPDSLVELLAFDPDVEGGFATNLNVLVEPVTIDITREQYFEATVSNVREQLGADVEPERLELPAGETLHLTYEQSGNAGDGAIATVQYVLFESDTGYVLTYTTLPPRLAQNSKEFERSARSFELR
jgi:hypothetical protein